MGSLLGWLFGGSSGGGGAGKIVGALDKAIFSKQERFELDAVDMKSVRSMLGTAGPGFVNQLVDAVNHAIRPTITVGLVGGLFGWWVMPDLSNLTPFYQTLVYLVFTFWFGGRAIVKDVPAMLATLRKIKAKYDKDEEDDD